MPLSESSENKEVFWSDRWGKRVVWHVHHREAQVTVPWDWRTSGDFEREGAPTKQTPDYKLISPVRILRLREFDWTCIGLYTHSWSWELKFHQTTHVAITLFEGNRKDSRVVKRLVGSKLIKPIFLDTLEDWRMRALLGELIKEIGKRRCRKVKQKYLRQKILNICN